MIHVGIDHHKRYSRATEVFPRQSARRLGDYPIWEGRLGNDRSAFENLKTRFIGDTPVRSVLEAGRNWGPLFDTLDELGALTPLFYPMAASHPPDFGVSSPGIRPTKIPPSWPIGGGVFLEYNKYVPTPILRIGSGQCRSNSKYRNRHAFC